ncbi:HAD-IIB family hydrolase [Plectonema cf. radiosum LEGE 06105]|uniref:HAD-IIB family hydrolase n=1 Tax=Plectonema cf. radiosum LEGE 06105 TaxID=945769 RepID=A0A8J7JYW8_9CYAN|nr:HAD-IIB family hydrolase [Plectonema cf. radiosum LEGE 06105]
MVRYRKGSSLSGLIESRISVSLDRRVSIRAFSQIDLFDIVIAENGPLLYVPANHQEKLLALKPPQEFVDKLRERGVNPSIGKVIVATWDKHEATVSEVINELGLDLEIILNKGALMILPTGINKASGLAAALEDMQLLPENVVGVGDAENDLDFLNVCGISVAVNNALPVVKEAATFVTKNSRGAGVTELIDKLIASDLSEYQL